MNNRTLLEAARQYNTPCYLFDLDAFTSRIRRMGEILGKQVNICYAMKANPFLTAAAARTAAGLEVCSPGEYAICRRAHVPARNIVLSGVNKEEAHIRSVMAEQGAGTYTAESLNQLLLLETCAAAAGLTGVRVLLRLTSGNQFGMDEEDVLASIRNRGSYPHLDLTGLQYYSGTQKKGLERIKKELEKLDLLLGFVREQLDFEFRELEYGPGFQIPYFEGQEQPDEEILLQEFKKSLDSLDFKGIIFLEAGRFLAAPCGSYLTRVADAKRCQGQNYCIVDGGINHVNYYGQTMAMKVPAYRYLPQDNPARRQKPEHGAIVMDGNKTFMASGHPPGDDTPASGRWTVCGSLCTSGDILVKNLPLEGLTIGDLLVFDRIGAYSVTEGIYLFLSRKLPAVLTYTQKQGLSLVRDVLPTDMLNDGSAAQIYQSQSGSSKRSDT